jgi:glutamine amidotransferase
MIAIVDYGSGNVRALANIFRQLRVDFRLATRPQELDQVSGILLPGVGAFDNTMSRLNESGLRAALEGAVTSGKPLLGICVGMQVLAAGSEEGTLPGLGLVPGFVRLIDVRALTRKPRLPHMGWNSIQVRGNPRLFDGLDLERGFYFLHSYRFCTDDPGCEAATVTYGTAFTCAVNLGNVWGVQFHPEKSHSNGISLLKNFAALCALGSQERRAVG